MGKRGYTRFCRAILLVGMPGWLIYAKPVKAAVQTETVVVSVPPEIVNFNGREIELPRFDPSLGSLESVTIDAQGTGALLQGFNHNGGSGSHRGLSDESILKLLLQTSAGESLVTLTQLGTHFGGSPGHPSGDGPADTWFVPLRTLGHTTLTSDQQLMQFTGCGFIDLFLSGRSGAGHSGTGIEGIRNGVWVAGANIKVTYTFTAVPETSTWLAGVFAVLLVLIKRSRACAVPSEQ